MGRITLGILFGNKHSKGGGERGEGERKGRRGEEEEEEKAKEVCNSLSETICQLSSDSCSSDSFL